MKKEDALIRLAGAIGFAGRGQFSDSGSAALDAWVNMDSRSELIEGEDGYDGILHIASRIYGAEIGDRLRIRMDERKEVDASDIAWLRQVLDSQSPFC